MARRSTGSNTDEGRLLSDRIRNTLTDEIASGALPSGTPLDEQFLASRFGASRTPVREALRQLIVSGLVEQPARRGLIVARITPQRILEMFEARAEIDAMCVRIATYRMTPLERAQLMDIYAASRNAASRGDYETYDTQFHETIYRATHNEFLAEQAIGARTRLNIFRRSQLRGGDRVVHSRAEHAAVLEAIAQGDGDMAARRMRAHMLHSGTSLGHHFAAQHPEADAQDHEGGPVLPKSPNEPENDSPGPTRLKRRKAGAHR
jgi:DNA-binding GntR family transcriptional regulator